MINPQPVVSEQKNKNFSRHLSVFLFLAFSSLFISIFLSLENPIFKIALLFSLGVILQSIFFISNHISKRNLKDIGAIMIISFILMAYIFAESDAEISSLPFFLIVFCFIFALLFYALFHKTLLLRINEEMIVFWNIIFWYLYIQNIGFNSLSVIILIPTIITFFIAFYPKIPGFFWKFFTYAWFLTMMIFIAFYNFKFGIFLNIVGWSGQTISVDNLDIILSGMVFMYILFYSIYFLIFLALLIPVTKQGQKFNLKERLNLMEKQASMMLEGYTENHPGVRLLLIIAFTAGILAVNSGLELIPDYILINILLIASFGLGKLEERKTPITI